MTLEPVKYKKFIVPLVVGVILWILSPVDRKSVV